VEALKVTDSDSPAPFGTLLWGIILHAKELLQREGLPDILVTHSMTSASRFRSFQLAEACPHSSPHSFLLVQNPVFVLHPTTLINGPILYAILVIALTNVAYGWMVTSLVR